MSFGPYPPTQRGARSKLTAKTHRLQVEYPSGSVACALKDCKFSDWHNWQSMPLVRGYVPFGPCDSVTTGSYLLQVLADLADSRGRSAVVSITRRTATVQLVRGPCGRPLELELIMRVSRDPAIKMVTALMSDCTRRCGGGLKTRTRSIEVAALPIGQNGSDSLERLEPCNEDVCETAEGGEGRNDP
ncbi:hypothetical protein AK812_SmicGene7213 [Symbiodinium microadriaticum]|uniref:Uncharacterized protein n=1 Tax=Symbiodinium microadriaticum TaxID=2951 RepID=A0A1Q9EP28_SYMMI|nr:hypothetical protein AK812_SmicGene7213 [Symbiodinium microadriaticum]